MFLRFDAAFLQLLRDIEEAGHACGVVHGTVEDGITADWLADAQMIDMR